MLAGMTPKEFDGWYAHYLLNPWDDAWRQAATIAVEIQHFRLAIESAAFGRKVHDDEFNSINHYIPKPTFKGKKRKKVTRRRSDLVDIKTDESNMAMLHGDKNEWLPLEH